MIGKLEYFEKEFKVKKIYILRALPVCFERCGSLAAEYIATMKSPLSTIGTGMIKNNNKVNAIRQERATKQCRKCELVDYTEALKNPDGNVTLYDSTRNLVYFDDGVHLNKFGFEKVRPVYEELARKLEAQLKGSSTN
ncbi:hypothetical protein WR25_25560 [Diploscapter pachys]|uniref:SGNH domain-containing protein n=1 Tax=Diploscapter pachys TaxID=2018661 RepID=A0A2A2KRW5_9BILA|nr:hypothetical protein WR25_25560 [Diploscapter pachys]